MIARPRKAASRTPIGHRVICEDISGMPLGEIADMVAKWNAENPGWEAYVETSLDRPALHARFYGRSIA